MTDPIKEQAEGLRYLFYGGRCYRIMPEGSSFTAKKSEMLNVSKAIETHIREKASLESQLAEAKAEIERLKDNHAKSRLAWEHKKNEIHAHNLELTQALKEAHEEVIRRSLRPYPAEEKVKKALSSPTSRKYLAMIAVVEAAKVFLTSWQNQDNDDEPLEKLFNKIEALESEEA